MARSARIAVTLLLLTLVALPAFGGITRSTSTLRGGGVSQIVRIRYWLAHPEEAPAQFRPQFQGLGAALAHWSPRMGGAAQQPPFGHVFNNDTTGLPQDEESVSVCTGDPRVVIGGTNDFRGLIDPEGNFTGWYFSNDGGATLTNEGLLPTVQVAGQPTPSGGDPVFVAGSNCNLYAATLNYLVDSGVGVYRTTPSRLAGCSGAACWPTRVNVDTAAPGHFLDKEWMDAGMSGSAGEVVWVAYGDLYDFDETGTEHGGTIKAIRCTADLSSCTAPIVVSVGQQVAEYPDVTIGPDGRVYITWTEFTRGSFTGPAELSWFAVAEAGSTTFSAPRPVFPKDQKALRGHPLGLIHSNDFRLIGTTSTNTVKIVNGQPRVFATWNRCKKEILGGVCEEAQVMLRYSDDLGLTWSAPAAISAGGDNYFQSIDTDPVTGAIVVAYYTSRYDPVFHNRQDVEVVTLDDNGRVIKRQRATDESNEPEADQLLQGAFIGDYLEVSAVGGTAYVHYNGNQRSEQFLGTALPEPQQDNYLAMVGE
jgi:hypothetical protein